MNQQELPADGGADAVNEQEPLADGGADAVRGNVAVPGADGPGEDQRLVALLRELVSGDRKMKTAAYLGVSYRTLDRALETGVLRSRIRDALKRRMLEEGGEAGLRHRARVEALEQRAESMDERVAALEQAQEATEKATSSAVGELARGLEDGNATVEALAGRLARLEQQRARERRSGAVGNGAVEPVTGPGRSVVTAEPQPGEAESYGASMALVEEWRTLIRRRGEGSKTEQAKDRERVMELEIVLIGEHGLALPPNTEPLHPSERERYLGWRRRELADLQGERRRRVALRWVRRVLTFGVWRR
ncbi:MAG: hypothetical protein OXI32_09080 [bacterium]|nr:hypothetical protein [bacterium]MYG92652.1 hypothetical protein [Acidimicrobiia bacterium]